MKTELETRETLTVEVLPEEEPVSVELWNGDRLRQAAGVKPDATIWDAVKILEPERGDFLAPTVCLVDDKPVMRAEWDKPIGRRRVMFCELPLGGGDGGSSAAAIVQLLTTIISLACLFIPVVGPWIALGVQLVGTLIAGALAMGSMGHQDAEGAEAASPTYRINASGNKARLFQPEPEGFGRMKIVPDYVAQTWTWFENNDQYAFFLFGIGRGEYDIESIYFGDSLFWSKTGGPTPMADGGDGYVNSSVNQSLTPSQGEPAWSVLIPIVEQGGSASSGRIVLSFPQGHGKWNYNAPAAAPPGWKYTPVGCTVEIQWCQLDASGNPQTWSPSITRTVGDGDSASTGSKGYADATAIGNKAKDKSFTASIPIAFGSSARWAIRVRNVTGIISATADPEYASEAVFQSVSITEVASTGLPIQIVPPGGEVTIFKTNVSSSAEVSGLLVPAPNDEDYPGQNGGWMGPYAANPPGTTATRIMIDWSLPSGIGKYNDEGDFCDYSVELEVEAQLIDDEGHATGNWFSPGAEGDPAAHWTFSGRTMTPQRRTRIFHVGSGRYQVRMRRINDTDKYNTRERSMDDVHWEGLKAVLPGQTRFPQTVLAVKVKATNILSQQASQNLSVIATRKLPIWDSATKTWSAPVATTSWAAALCAICQEPWGGCLPDSQLDLDKIWAINAALPQGWGFNAYIDGHYALWPLIVEACQAVCCVPRLEGTVLSVVKDDPGRPVSYELNARNIVRGSFQVTYQTWTDDTPDDVIMNYLDASAFYQQRDVQARLPASESAEPVTLDWIGITGREQAFRVGVRYAAMNRYRRVSVTCQVEALGKLIQAGDVVSVNHPRVRETRAGVVTGWDAENLVINIDADFKSDSDSAVNNRYISLTRPDGSVWGPVKGTVSSSGHAFILNSADYADWLAGEGGKPRDAPWSWLTAGDDIQPTTYAIHAARTFSRRMLVQSVVPEDAGHFTLTLCNDAEEVFSFDNLPVPTWNARSNANAPLEEPETLSVSFNAAGTVATATWSKCREGPTSATNRPSVPQYELHCSTDLNPASSEGATWTHLGTVTATKNALVTKSFAVPLLGSNDGETWTPIGVGGASDHSYTYTRPADVTGVRVRAVSPSAVSIWKVWTPSS